MSRAIAPLNGTCPCRACQAGMLRALRSPAQAEMRRTAALIRSTLAILRRRGYDPEAGASDG